MSAPSNSGKYAALGGQVILITAASVEQTGFVKGRTYEFAAIGGMALVRNDTSAAAASDGGFDFAVPDGAVVRFVARDTIFNVIEADASSTATAVLAISEVEG